MTCAVYVESTRIDFFQFGKNTGIQPDMTEAPSAPKAINCADIPDCKTDLTTLAIAFATRSLNI